MNLGELRAAVFARAGLQPSDPVTSVDEVDGFVNAALAAISTRADWWWLDDSETLTTVADTATVSMSALSVRTRALTIDDDQGGEITEISLAELRHHQTASSGRPRRYAEDGSTLVLLPTPDAAYDLTHDFVTAEPLLDADDDEPLIPARYQPAVVDYAAHLLLSQARDEERAKSRFDTFQWWEERMRDDARRSTRPKLPRIRDGSQF